MSALSKEIENVINEQIKMEAQSSALYLAIAAWCSSKGYDNSSEFFFTQAEEERMHMLKLFRYLCDLGGTAVSPEVSKVKSDFKSLKEVFESALEAEQGVSKAIHSIVACAKKNQDFGTENFMQWFVKEQIEEEFIMRRAVDLFGLMGEDKLAIFMIDERIPKIKFNQTNADTNAADA
jgi:ferritin